MSRIRIHNSNENRPVFDFLKQTNPVECLHIDHDMIFLLDLVSTMKYIERFDRTNTKILLEVLHQQVQTSNDPDYWNNVYVCIIELCKFLQR